MADSEGSSPDANDSNPTLPPVAKPLAPAPRVNPPNVNAAKEAPPVVGPPGFTDFLEWMRSQTTGETAAGTAAQRGLIPKEKKKFQRQDTETKSDKSADLSSADSDPSTKEVSAPPAKPPLADPSTPVVKMPVSDVSVPTLSPKAETEAAPTAKGLTGVPENSPNRVRRQQVPLKRNAWLGLLMQAAMLALLAGSFVLGRFSVSKVVTTSIAPAAPEMINSEGKTTTKLLSDANSALIDQAMAAEQDLNFDKAEELLKQVKASGEHVYGLTFQMAQLALFQRDFHKAMPLLNASISENENLDDAYNLRATVVGQAGIVRNAAMNDYETATKIDPFGARNFFYWGEALRRMGKDQAAIVRLKQAVDRLREPELESSYRLKLRLAQLEAGLEEEFTEELAKQLASPNPEMDWLITAAAVEINNGKFAAAAGYLDRAASRGDTDSFASRLRDYYLYQFKDNKELTRFYAKAPTSKLSLPENPPAPAASPGQDASSPPAIGLDVPTLPPPASPGATVPR